MQSCIQTKYMPRFFKNDQEYIKILSNNDVVVSYTASTSDWAYYPLYIHREEEYKNDLKRASDNCELHLSFSFRTKYPVFINDFMINISKIEKGEKIVLKAGSIDYMDTCFDHGVFRTRQPIDKRIGINKQIHKCNLYYWGSDNSVSKYCYFGVVAKGDSLFKIENYIIDANLSIESNGKNYKASICDTISRKIIKETMFLPF